MFLQGDNQLRRLVLCLAGFGLLYNCGRAAGEELVRRVELTAALSIQSPAEGTIKVWLPVPQSSPFQSVTQVVRHEDLPLKLTRDRRYSNEMLYGEGNVAEQGRLDFEIVWDVTRREVRGDDLQSLEVLSADTTAVWLKGSPKVPIGGKPLRLLGTLTLPEDAAGKARLFYDRVLEHMRYDKSRPGYGNGDAVWACDSRFGNCPDFHSLFMSLARSHSIPSRFEIGHSLPAGQNQGDLQGYHCWAWYSQSQGRWTPVDISEADKHPELSEYYFGNLSPDRIAFSVGRYIVLHPPQQGPPLNYFVKPYVEIDGRPIDAADVMTSLSFHDMDVKRPE